jgi:monothiol glutaredoxin
MVMSVGTVYMAVGDFLVAGGAHFQHLDIKAQRLARVGVVAVEVHLWALDLDHGKDMLGAVFAPTFELAAHLHTGRELGFGNRLDQRCVVLTEGVSGCQLNRSGEAYGLAFERFFDLGEGIAIATMQVGNGFLALVQQLATGVGNLELQRHCGVFGDVHGLYYLKKPCRLRAMPPRSSPPVGEGEIIGVSIDSESRLMSDAQQRIDELVKSNEILLFMKGNASFPQCGFSGRAIQILKACGVDPKTVKTVNVLEDDGIRQGIKEYSNWPTIPQLYVKGEFIGGSDIMMEMYENGELAQALGTSPKA